MSADHTNCNARGALVAAGLLDAFRGILGNISAAEVVEMIANTPIEADVLADGERLWFLLLADPRRPQVLTGEDK